MTEGKFKIFDAHLHVHGIFLNPEESLIDYMDRHGVDKAVITTTNRAASSKLYAGKDDSKSNEEHGEKINEAFKKFKNMIPKTQLDHQDVIEISRKAPRRFYKFFWFNPRIKQDMEELNYKILEDHFKKGFCGVKIHSGIHLIKVPRDVIKLASFMQEFNEKIPLFIHSTPKTMYFAGVSTKNIARLADEFPKLRIIVGHAGFAMEYAIECGLNLKRHANIYFETSCSSPYSIFSLVKSLRGQERIFFGSDAPITNPIQIEIDKITCLPLTTEQKQDILYNNISKLLN